MSVLIKGAPERSLALLQPAGDTGEESSFNPEGGPGQNLVMLAPDL